MMMMKAYNIFQTFMSRKYRLLILALASYAAMC